MMRTMIVKKSAACFTDAELVEFFFINQYHVILYVNFKQLIKISLN